jgi:hypothetical protein
VVPEYMKPPERPTDPEEAKQFDLDKADIAREQKEKLMKQNVYMKAGLPKTGRWVCKHCGLVSSTISAFNTHRFQAHPELQKRRSRVVFNTPIASDVPVQLAESPFRSAHFEKMEEVLKVERIKEEIYEQKEEQITEKKEEVQAPLVTKKKGTNLELLQEAFSGIKDSDSKSALGTVMTDGDLEFFGPETLYNKCWNAVHDGDARAVIHRVIFY